MARFDVRQVRGLRGAAYVLDLQSDQFAALDSVIVAPLVEADGVPPIPFVTPTIEIDGVSYLVRTEQLAAIPRNRLGETITNVADREYDLVRALDRLLSRA